jgi:hypothetical protein
LIAGRTDANLVRLFGCQFFINSKVLRAKRAFYLIRQARTLWIAMRTDEDVIKNLVRLCGGLTEAADELGTSKQNLHNWRIRGAVPPGWRTVILCWAREHGHRIVDQRWAQAGGPLEEALRLALRRAAHRNGGTDGGAGKGESREAAQG